MVRRARDRRGYPETWRLFVAAPLPLPVLDLVSDVQDELEPEDWPFRWVDPSLTHITLKFLGDTPVRSVNELTKKLRWVAGRTDPHVLKTGQLGAFPSTRRPRVVWLGLTGDTVQLERIAEDIDEISTEFGFQKEERRFQAHITLGRLQKHEDPPADFEAILQDVGLPIRNVPIERIQLMRSVLSSAGPEYSLVDQWALGKDDLRTRSLEHG